MYDQIFFTNVLRLLDEQKMTKSELAGKSGISVSFLSDLTNGKANPSLKFWTRSPAPSTLRCPRCWKLPTSMTKPWAR